MIPQNAKCVFRGIMFNVYQWEQKMYDGSVQTFEALRRPNTVEILATTPGRTIVTLEQEQPDSPRPFFSIPGGRIAEGENPLDAAKRELLEETGYGSDDWSLLKIFEPSGRIAWTIYVYAARDCREIARQTLDVGERIEVNTITLDELLTKAEQDDFRHSSLRFDLIRARYDPDAKKQLQNQLFTSLSSRA